MSRSEVLDTIRSRVGEENLSRSHRREGCRVYLDGVPSQRITVDADLAFPAKEFEGSRCDLVLFLFDSDGKLVTVPTELKGEMLMLRKYMSSCSKGHTSLCASR